MARALGWREWLRINVLWFTITLVVTSLALIVVLQLWRADPHVPTSLGLDNEFTLMTIKNVLREGWVNQSPRLGAPFGQQLYDFPVASADVLQLLIIKGIGLVISDPAAVMNCFYGLSFLMVSATAFMAFRLLKISPSMASAGAVLFSFLPYHFVRGGYYGHLTLSSYFMVPLACALVVRQLGDEPLFQLRRDAGGRAAQLARARAGLALIICVMTALSSVYYAAFTLSLLAFAGAVRALAVRSIRPLLSSVLLGTVMVVTLATALLPNISYIVKNGPNNQVARRLPADSEVLGLKIVNLVLPTPEHRIAALDSRYAERSAFSGEGTEALGLIGVAGLMGLLFWAFRRLLSSGGSASSQTNGMATLLLFLLLLGAVAGLSGVVASLGLVQIRAWNRLSVFVAFLALGAVGLAVDRLSSRGKGSVPAVTRLALCLGLVAVGVTDQTTTAFVPRYGEVARTWRSDQSFMQAVEKQYGEADLFQVPIMPFPESTPVGKLWGDAHLKGYLHSEKLRWSFGGMRGREADWQSQLLPLPTLEAVSRVALAGFEALYIDRAGYSDRGIALERPLEPVLGQPLVRSDGRLAVYDLRPLRQELEAQLGPPQAARVGQLALHPMRLRWSSDFGPEVRTEALSIRSAESQAEVAVVNGDRRSQRAVFDFELESPPGTAVTVESDNQSQTLRSDGGRDRFRFELLLRAGETKVRFQAQPLRPPGPFTEGVPRRLRVGYTAKSVGDMRFSVLNPRVDQGGPDLADLLESVPLPAPAPAVIPPPGAPHRPFPPLLMLGAVLALGVVFVVATDQCLRALLYPQQRPRLRRPPPAR